MHTVTRICQVCRIKQDKNKMSRIVKCNDSLKLDNQKKLSGKAVYVCQSEDCVKNLYKRKTFNKAFRCNFSDESYSKILEEINNCKQI